LRERGDKKTVEIKLDEMVEFFKGKNK